MEPEETLEQEAIEQEPVVDTEVEQSSEQPESEPAVETPVEPEPQPEPINVRTGGKWVLVEEFLSQEFEDGKTYHIKVKGNCEFMISKDEPTTGIKTNEITFKKEPDVNLWIKTGV